MTNTQTLSPEAMNIARGNLLGLLLLALGYFMMGTVDMMAKYLTQYVHPFQIVWFRQFGLFVMAVMILSRKGTVLLRTRRPVLQLLRGSSAAISALCFVTAIRYAPIADATAVSFIAPLLVTAMGAIFLGETVGRNRWIAVLLGFVGALIVIRPGFSVFHPAIGLVVAAASFFSIRQVLSRVLASQDRTSTTIVYTAVTSFVLLTVLQPFVWHWPQESWIILLMLAMAGCAAVTEFLVIRAFELAQVVVVAPMHYSIMIWATFYGWLIFGQLPDLWTWVGTGVIFATGIFLIYRERLAARRIRAGRV
ncbi:DMT family transporter [Aliiruegeria lutimaris]|uniref:S-adenosylmethionine uptake transporter n=1 Tax=Aliiruegeria lutimaris TaxID=571298 RepID=A0A1G8MTR5_9RHOB|nr:DMT family transporter [Aliiruegeria lutimaris]SDI71256.1 S-adenosylmethionine uptake transporter [Aliiruegeria lutimaris]